MKKNNRLPREQARVSGDQAPGSDSEDGLNLGTDVEGHRAQFNPALAPRLPGTGGDLRRPTGSGEIDGDDVEGHSR